MHWLEVLVLENNSINTIGYGAGNVIALTSFDVTYNGLEKIAKSIGDFQDLHILHPSKNPKLEMSAIKTAFKCQQPKHLDLPFLMNYITKKERKIFEILGSELTSDLVIWLLIT